MHSTSEQPIIVDPHVSEPREDMEIIVPKSYSTGFQPEADYHDLDAAWMKDVQNLARKLNDFLGTLPQALVDAYKRYRELVLSIVALLLSVVGLAIASGVLRVLEIFPLISSFLQLIGLGCCGWFSWRYLLYADSRKELVQKLEQLWDDIAGHPVH